MLDRPAALLLTADRELQSAALAWQQQWGVELLFYDNPAEAVAAGRKRPLRLVILDARASMVASPGLLRRFRELPTEPEILILLEPGEAIPEALSLEQVHHGGTGQPGLEEQVQRLLALASVRQTSGLVGQSPAMRELLSTIAQVAPLDVPVLIQGESGTGKEMVARALHDESPRVSEAFVSINVGSIAETLLESELFGHEKGAFTGAIARREGVFERANRGTLFLDELGEMPPAMQVRLLRVLESGEFIRVGGGTVLRTDVRLVAATNRSLEVEMASGRFRTDLYYRLKVIRIEIPPLRDRPEDIPALVQHFIEDANRRHGTRSRGLTRDAMERFLSYAWPGNVRELRNVVSSMAVLAGDEYLGMKDLPPELIPGRAQPHALPALALERGNPSIDDPLLASTLLGLASEVRRIHERIERLERHLLRPDHGSSELRGPLSEITSEAEFSPVGPDRPRDIASAERALIEAALRQHAGNRRQTAEQLGISERTLYRKLKSYGLG